MDAPLLYFATGIVAILLMVWFARRGKTRLTDQWHRAFALAQELVPAVEQLFQTGHIRKEQRLDMVMRELRVHFPQLQEYHLRWAVENAVHWMNNNGLVELTAVEETANVVNQATQRLNSLFTDSGTN